MANSLYEAIKAEVPQGKTRIGYTVDAYNDILDALHKDKEIVIQNVIYEQGSAQMQQRYFTVLGNAVLQSSDELLNGFYYTAAKDQNTEKTPLYQASCSLKDFMSFPIDYTSGSEQKKAMVSVNKGQTMSNGHSEKPGMTFPPYSVDSNVLDKLKEGGSEFYVGVGISFESFAEKFFNTFFPDSGLKANKIKKIASDGHLYAEILIPTKGNNAKALHAKVIINSPANDKVPFDVWIPVPILMLDDFKELGTVTVETTKQEKVGTGNVKFPFANGRYYHKNANITGFGASGIEGYIGAKSKYVSCSLANGGTETLTRVRLYFDEAARGSITSPHDEMFKSTTSQAEVVKREVIYGSDTTGNFNTSGHVILDVGHVRGHNDNSGVTDRCEYDFNHDYVAAIYNLLQQKGISVGVLDYPSMGNDQEINRLNREIKASGCMILICVHNNAAVKYGPDGKPLRDSNGKQIPDPKAYGGCCVMPTNTKNPNLDKQLTETFAHDIARIMPGRSGGGIQKGAGYGITRGLSCAVGYLECGFYTNPDDVRKMTKGSPQFKELTKCVADGIEKFYKKYKT